MPDQLRPEVSLAVPARRREQAVRKPRRPKPALAAVALARGGVDNAPPSPLPLAADAPALVAAGEERLPLAEMAGGIAHDFRNLLAVIASALDLAGRHRSDPDRLDQYLSGARDAVDRAAALSSRLLALARPAPSALRPENLSGLIRDSLSVLAYSAGPKVLLRLDLNDGGALCPVDSARFGAALLNLVANARDAMPGGGEILISTGIPEDSEIEPGRFVRVRVSDSGHGMSAEVAARIFDPWFTTKATAGNGLGLPQVQRLMTLVGGRVGVTTGAAGTSVDLFFPLAGAIDPLPESSAPACARSAAGGNEAKLQ